MSGLHSATLLSASFVVFFFFLKKCFLPVGPALVADILVRAEAGVAAAKAVILRVDLGPGGSSLV